MGGVFGLLRDGCVVVGAQGNFVYVSAACERIFGYTPQEMLGKRMIEMVYPEDRARTLAAAKEVMADQPLLHFENRYVRKDGGVVHIMWRSEEHTSELQSLMRISYAVFCLKKKKQHIKSRNTNKMSGHITHKDSRQTD